MVRCHLSSVIPPPPSKAEFQVTLYGNGHFQWWVTGRAVPKSMAWGSLAVNPVARAAGRYDSSPSSYDFTVYLQGRTLSTGEPRHLLGPPGS